MESRARRAPGGLHAAGAMSAGNPPRGTPARRAPPFQTRRKGSTKDEGRRTNGRGERGALQPIRTGRGRSNNINNYQQLGNVSRAKPPATNSRHAEWCGFEMLLTVVEVVSNFPTPLLQGRGGLATSCLRIGTGGTQFIASAEQMGRPREGGNGGAAALKCGPPLGGRGDAVATLGADSGGGRVSSRARNPRARRRRSEGVSGARGGRGAAVSSPEEWTPKAGKKASLPLRRCSALSSNVEMLPVLPIPMTSETRCG